LPFTGYWVLGSSYSTNTSYMKPLCFVIMPFGTKPDAQGKLINFNDIFKGLIQPAIEAAGMEAIRADEETVNGIIHKPMYERLILCDYAVADLTTANANVFYELGIRHAVKPFSTIPIFALGSTLPFDLNAVRCLPYHYDAAHSLTDTANDIDALAKQLKNAMRSKATDSPVYQLVDGISFQNSVAHQKTDIFRDQVAYNKNLKDLLDKTRKKAAPAADKILALDAIVNNQIDVNNEEAGVLIDIMLSYRSLQAFDKMIAFINALPLHVKNTVMVQEQLGFALNRAGDPDQAIEVLNTVLQQNGPSSETYGILGRVYKDKYQKAFNAGNELLAEALLDKAIDIYTKGLEADWRDAYPGVNVLSLLYIKGDQQQVQSLLPVVSYAVKRKLQSKTPDYWDYASLMEMAVVSEDENAARAHLKQALACDLEGNWMLQTTLENLSLLAAAVKKRNGLAPVAEKMIALLKPQIT